MNKTVSKFTLAANLVLVLVFTMVGSVWARQTKTIIVKYNNNGNVVWEKSLGGNKDDYYSSVTAVPDGVVAVGRLDSSAIIVKYDNDGNIVWEKKSKNSSYSSVTTVSDGVVAVGSSLKKDFGNNAIIVKYDNNGRIVWEKIFNEGDDNSYESVTPISDGVVAIGNSDSGGDGNSFIVKYDNKGKVVWKKNTTCFMSCKLTTVPDGLVAVGSYYPEAIIIKYDNKGNVAWEKKRNIEKDGQYYSVTQVSDGVLAVGGIRTFGGNTIIVKYDNEGKDAVWETKKKFNPAKTGSKRYHSVTTVSDGVVLLGTFASNIYKNGAPITTTIIDKYDDNGNIVWEKDGINGYSYSSMTVIPDGMVVVGKGSLKSGSTVYDKQSDRGINGLRKGQHKRPAKPSRGRGGMNERE